MKNDTEYLKHIRDECLFLIENYEDLSFEEFNNSEVLKRAAVRSIEIVGEAVKKITDETKAENESIEWKDIARMRDVLIHQYFGVDFEIVWDVITKDIPVLIKKIEKVLEKSK